MTKEEIRGGIEELIPANYITSSVKLSKGVAADKILAYLHSQGVVIKVDRELPKSDRYVFPIAVVNAYEAGQEDMLKAGYVAVEPLIE